MSKTHSKDEEYITRYSPKVKRRNPKMRAQEVNIKIVEFLHRLRSGESERPEKP